MINYSVYLNRHVFVMVDRHGTKQPVHPVGVARAVTVHLQDHSVLIGGRTATYGQLSTRGTQKQPLI